MKDSMALIGLLLMGPWTFGITIFLGLWLYLSRDKTPGDEWPTSQEVKRRQQNLGINDHSDYNELKRAAGFRD